MGIFSREQKSNNSAEPASCAGLLQIPARPIREDRAMFNETHPIARVNVGTQANEEFYRNVYLHDLLTFDILQEEISLLNALYLDAIWGYSGEDKYPTNKTRFEWIMQTHPYSSRGVTVDTYCRWCSLVSFLAYERN